MARAPSRVTAAEAKGAFRSPAIADLAPHAQTNGKQTSQATHHKRSFHVYLSRWLFCLCWWLVVVFHTVLLGFAVSVAMLYQYLQQDNVMSFFGTLPFAILAGTAFSFSLVACGHLVAISRMLWYSVHARELRFHGVTAAAVGPPAIKPPQPQTAPSRTCCFIPWPVTRLYDSATTAWRRYFSVDGLFGLNGKYFELAFTIREAIEIALQTYQAYQLSLFSARVWINQLAVGAIVLNCFASPFIHAVFHYNVGVKRLLTLVQDSVLDFTCSVVIPFAIAVPYALVFETATLTFPMELVNNDVWYAKANAEIRQVLVTSFPDFVSTVLPQLSLLGCLMTLKNVIRHRPTRIGNAAATPGESVHPKTFAPSIPQVVVSERTLVPTTRCIPWRNKFLHACFMLWGLGVLGLHLQASHTIANRAHGCQLYVGAWYSSGLACSVMNLNCHMHQIQGSTKEIAFVLDQLDRTTLRILVYSHCPALQIPQVATEFPRLLSLELFNCSLVEWPEEAALRQSSQPMVQYLYLILTNWTTFPAGILHDQLPLGIEHLLVVGSNLTELPPTIGDLWSRQEWKFVAIDKSPFLQELPASFCKLHMQVMSLASTGIHTLPENCFQDTLALAISGSPIQKLTSSVAVSSLIYIEAEHTPLAELPAYLDTYLRDHPSEEAAKLYGSPMCDTANPRSFHTTTYCEADYHTTEGSYGWEFMLPQRQFEQ